MGNVGGVNAVNYIRSEKGGDIVLDTLQHAAICRGETVTLTAKEYDLLDPSKVIFISFSHHMCKRLAEKLPKFTVQYLNGEKSPQKLSEDGINGLDYHFNVLKLNKKWAEEARELGMTVNTWTVNKEDDMKAMFEQKVNMLTTDVPLEARKLMKQLKINKI